jgi:hypothetical protein
LSSRKDGFVEWKGMTGMKHRLASSVPGVDCLLRLAFLEEKNLRSVGEFFDDLIEGRVTTRIRWRQRKEAILSRWTSVRT